MSKPTAYTVEEAREQLLAQFRMYARYWANLPDKSPQERCDGLAFSLLNIFDGTTVRLPSLDITLRPHESDKAFHQKEGERWYEDGMIINQCMLHELYYPPPKKPR